MKEATRVWMKKIISVVPFGSVLTRVVLSLGFPGSTTYWEERYAGGGNSGVGSYGSLADFKSRFIRNFIREHDIHSIIDFGCGDGNQIGFLDVEQYVGLDVSATAVQMCRDIYRNDPTKKFIVYGAKDRFEDMSIDQSDMAMSLDVIYHLVEDELFEAYLANLFSAATRFVVIYASDFDGMTESPHMRHRKFTSYIEKNVVGWILYEHTETPNKGEHSDSDFFVYRHADADMS